MKIRPKNIPKFLDGGISTVNWTNPESTWFTRSGGVDRGILEGTYNYLKVLRDKWQSTKSLVDYQVFKNAVDQFNNDQRERYAPNHLKYLKENNQLFQDNSVGDWQTKVNTNYKYINDAIGSNFKEYNITSKNPYTGDNPTKGWKVDNYWAGITDDRTPWGYYSNPNDKQYLLWKNKFKEIGIDYRPNEEWGTGNVLYGFLTDKFEQEDDSTKQNMKENLGFEAPPMLSYPNGNQFDGLLNNKDKLLNLYPKTQDETQDETGGSVRANHTEDDKNGSPLKKGISNINWANLIAAGRLIGNIWNNERVFGEQIKGIRPDLKQTYNTYRQVVGDEATKQAYYRRAAQGQTKAAQPFTSDADKQIAYQMEAKRIGDELRAQGDLADNQEIRRTSDESNQHQWANTQRVTEVANANVAAINYANALKHNLLAQKHSANWTSIDNELLARETRLLQQYERKKALQQQLGMYDIMSEQYDQPSYKKILEISDQINQENSKASPDYNKIVQLQREKQKYQIELNKWKLQRQGTLIAKSGGKVTHKKKDDLLYKTARDNAEHFLKASKLSSDALNRKRIKIEKLTSHPKGRTRKFQQGGLAPFTIYRPATLGGETSTQVSTGSDSSSSKKGSDTLDLVKNLFKDVKGLPSDVGQVYRSMQMFLSNASMFGEEISTEDIASMYLQQMQKLSQVSYFKESFDKAREHAIQNDAMNEFAVDTYGRVIVQTQEGSIKPVSVNEYKENIDKYNPLTNEQLLNIRALSPAMAFQTGQNDLIGIVSNSVGLNKIAEQIGKLKGNIGTTELVKEGYTHHQANQIKQGFELLIEAPEGDYKFTNTTKDQNDQIKAAFNYITKMLPKNYMGVLELNAAIHGTTAEGLISSMLASQYDLTQKQEFSAVTGKAAKDSNGNSKDDSEGLKLDAATALISGKGYQGIVEFNPGTSYAVTVNARHSGFQKKSGENMGSGITMQQATTSTLDKVLDWNKATLGGSRLNSTAYNRIVINNDDVVGVDLPVGSDKNTPDFTMLQKLQLLDQELLKRGIEDTSNNWKQINQICQELGLPAKYKNDGSLNEYSWNRFAAFQVTADDSVLVNKNAILSDILGVVEDDNVREQYEQIIQKDNKNYKLGSGFLGLGKQALYQGTVFVPINSNYVASALSGGQNISMQQATNLELKERGYNQQKIATYKPGININEL